MAAKQRLTAGQVWERTLTMVSKLLREFDHEMQKDSGISIIWYDVLLHLYIAPEKKMRMQVLSDSLILTRTGATRLVDRIEKAGLVRREAVPEDRRGYYAILSEEGERVLRLAQKAHRRDIRKHFGAHLSKDEQQTLYELVTRVFDANSGR